MENGFSIKEMEFILRTLLESAIYLPFEMMFL